MITKLRKLQLALKILGHRGHTICIDYALPNTRAAIDEAFNTDVSLKGLRTLNSTKRKADVYFDVHSPLELTFVTFDDIEIDPKLGTCAQKFETEFASAEIEWEKAKAKVSKDPIGGQINITEEFVDAALVQVLAKVKEKFRAELLEDLVNKKMESVGL